MVDRIINASKADISPPPGKVVHVEREDLVTFKFKNMNKQKRHRPEENILLLRECDTSELSQERETDLGRDPPPLAQEVWNDERGRGGFLRTVDQSDTKCKRITSMLGRRASVKAIA